MSDTLRLKSEIISLEAESGDVAMQQALTRLPGLFDEAVTVFGKYIGNPLKALFEKRDFSWTVAKLQNRNYSELRSQEIFVPAGLQSDLLTYVADLEKAAAYADRVKKDVLDPFNVWLGEKIASPDQMKSITARIAIKDFKPTDLKKITTELTNNFASAGKQESVKPYGLVVRNNGEWNRIAEHSDTINRFFTEEKHKLILKTKDELQDRLDILIHRLQENPEEFKMSPAALTALSTATYDTASALEFYALVRYKVQELNVALRDTEARMKDWLK